MYFGKVRPNCELQGTILAIVYVQVYVRELLLLANVGKITVRN